MKTHPILFSTAMVQAILEGRKTMTRRVIKPQPKAELFSAIISYSDKLMARFWTKREPNNPLIEDVKLKYNVGDVLWVRESFCHVRAFVEGKELQQPQYLYKTDPPFGYVEDGWKWKPSIYMPKIACRIWLEVTSIRVERLQDITYVDGIIQEGYPKEHPGCSPIEWFENLWAKINGKESWKSNPYVWVIEFKKVTKPENF